jgi:Zn-dependent protease with chaperone function
MSTDLVLAGQLLQGDPTASDNFGQCVAIDGDTAVVGAWQWDQKTPTAIVLSPWYAPTTTVSPLAPTDQLIIDGWVSCYQLLLLCPCCTAANKDIGCSQKRGPTGVAVEYSPDDVSIDAGFVAFYQQCMTSYTLTSTLTLIEKQKSTETFTQTILTKSKLDKYHSFTMDDASKYMTSSLIKRHSPRFMVPAYSFLMHTIVVPQFADMIIQSITRYTVIREKDMTFWFYLPDSTDNDAEHKLTMQRAVETVLFMRKVFPDKLDSLTVHILLVDKPKVYDSAYGIPGQPLLVNSGIAYDDHTIVIFRKEEVLKVLVHELCHILNVDAHKYSWSISRALQDNITTIEGAFNPTEAITETIAQLLYSILVSKWSKQPLEDVLRIQVKHGLQQAAKVLILNKVYTLADLKTAVITQKTYMFEYFVLRASLMLRACTSPQLLSVLFNNCPYFKDLSDANVSDAVQCALLTDFTEGSKFAQLLNAAMALKFTDLSLKMNAF